MTQDHTCSLGGGVIGASWTALFLAAGKSVAVHDINPAAEQNIRDYVENAWPVLEELGLAESGNPDAITFHIDPRSAVEGAGFIQESVPENVAIKHDLFATIEDAVDAEAIVASSASGLTLTEMQGGWKSPDRFIIGHPFNPPHLIPLVEVLGNDNTQDGVVEQARAFYESIGKITIQVHKEVAGHVANRLQAAVWREAINLTVSGVASVEDVDTAMRAGPGLRWAAMGPTLLFHLGAGDGGLTSFCERYTDSYNRWFDDLGTPHLNPEIAAQLVEGVAAEVDGKTTAELSAERDALLSAIIRATAPLRD